MSELQIFNNEEFGTIRVIEIDGEPWFVGKDVALALGYSNTRKAIADHVEKSDKMDGVTIRDSIGREQNPTFISESGMYALIFGSKLESARRFKYWITSEVLPSIRKTGSYALPAVDYQMSPESISDEALDSLITNPRFIARLVIMFDKVTKENAHLKDDNEKLRIEAKENEGKISYANAVQPHAKEITITELARMLHQLGVADAGSIRLYNWLRENEYLIKRKGNTWNLPTQVYTNAELFMVRTVQVPNQNIVKRQTLVTPKGQEYFIKKFAKAKFLNDVTSKAVAVVTAINNEFKFDEETSD